MTNFVNQSHFQKQVIIDKSKKKVTLKHITFERI